MLIHQFFFNMKHKILLSLVAVLLTALSAQAYSFQSGDLYYNTTSDTTVEVAYQSKSSDNYQGLTTATIPETVTYNGTTYSVTSIGKSAFKWCFSLTSVTIPTSVTSIEYEAFDLCSSLTSVTIPNSVTSIGNYAFQSCSSLTSVTIPNSVTSIGYYAFYGCSSLTSISIPNSVTSIGKWAFSGCSSLTSVTIPTSVTSIGKSAFRGCSSIADIYCYATTPPICDDDNTFSGVNEHCYIHVPAGTIPNYQVATGWRYFSNFLEISGETAISEKTAISETEQQNKSARKIIRDGQVLILRNGVTYDMMGNTL